MKTSEHALLAADLLERKGWCQGRSHDTEGRICLMAAIAEIDKQNMDAAWPVVSPSYQRLTQALIKKFDAAPVHFNDKVATSITDVTIALREVAATLANKGE